jgi:hypothetical protein
MGLSEVLTTPHCNKVSFYIEFNKPRTWTDRLCNGKGTWNLVLGIRWIFRRWDVGAWTGLIWLRIGIDGRIF